MGLRELVDRVATLTGLDRRDVQATLQSALHIISANVLNGDRVTLKSFGVFLPKDTRAGLLFGKTLSEARRTIHFKPARKR